MSEQPRRRRRQIELDDAPQIPQDGYTVMPMEEHTTTQDKKSQCQWKNRPFGIACLVSSGIYIIMMVACVAPFIFNRLVHNAGLQWKHLLYYGSISIVFPLLTTFVFVLDSKEKRIFAIVSAAIVSLLSIDPFILRYLRIRLLPITLSNIGKYGQSSIPILFPYILLFAFAVTKKKRRGTWAIIGTIILLFQTTPSLIFDSRIKWMYLSHSNNTVGLLIEPVVIRANIYWLYRLFDLVYGLVFFFGMMNIPKTERTGDKIYHNTTDYSLLEQYKREHGM